MYPSIEKLKTILVHGNYLSQEDSKTAGQNIRDAREYVDQLIRQELLSKPLLGQALAEYYKLPYADLDANPVGKQQLALIPETIARQLRVVVLKTADKAIAVATDQPEAFKLGGIQPLFKGKKIHIAYALPEHIDTALSQYTQPLETRFSKIISSGTRVAPEIVDEILKDAIGFRASDIHFEPHIQEVTVRFRVDGSLREAGTIPKEYYENVLNRIKVESGMRIDEHLTAQDGAIQRRNADYSADLRISLVPTVQGEKVVMRLLGSYLQGYSLSDIGFDQQQQELIASYARKPFGMILTTGPTGSGKTTTLYTLLKLLNKPDVNITTIEDPVEYKIDGINQIQVREASNMTFARGLRAIVRQDPNIILVGEIRDKETAEISVNAALTGHLLLSTFHANDAATAIPRLVDLGIEPFLLASTLEIVIAQRLVRKICAHCRYSISAKQALGALKSKDAPVVARHFTPGETLYSGKGCAVCSNSGYLGRQALFEFIEVTPAMQELILTSPSTREIAELSRKQGSTTMFEDGITKAKNGVTSIEEVLRVVRPPRKA